MATRSLLFRLSTTLVAVTILTAITTPSSAQFATTTLGTPQQMGQTTGAPQQAICSARFEAAITPECFDASGVNFTGVIYLLSGNRSGAIPDGHTYTSFQQLLCSSDTQDKIVPCVLNQMQKFNNSQCTDQDRDMLMRRGNQLLAFVEMICGQPCEGESTQTLMQCYAAINVNPLPIIGPNATIVEDKYSVIGKSEAEFDNFCTNRQKLFSCLSPLFSVCSGLLKRLYLIGMDFQAMETTTGFLCSDKQKFLKGLTCFNTTTPDSNQCVQTTASSIRTVLAGRYQTGTIIPSKYQENLCKTKLAQVECELAAYGKSCDADYVSLRTSAECTMLPKPCREGAQFQTQYSGICQKITTPVPGQTVRPTQGRIEAASTSAGNPGATGANTFRNSATSVSQSMTLFFLLAVIANVSERMFL